MMFLSVDTSEADRLAIEFIGVSEAIRAVAYHNLDKAAAEVQAKASADAPVLTGELAGSIYNRRIGDDIRSVGSDVRQAFFQEFGTSRHGPQPFLFENAERVADGLVDRLVDAVDVL